MARPKPQTSDDGILQTFAGGATDPQLLDHTDKRQLDEDNSFVFRLLSLKEPYAQIAPFVQCVRKYKTREGEIKRLNYHKAWVPAEGLDGVYDDDGSDLGKLISERSRAKAQSARIVFLPVLAMYMTDKANNIRKDFKQEVMYIKATSSIMQNLLQLSEDAEEPWDAEDLPTYALRLTRGTAANGNPEYKLRPARKVGSGKSSEALDGDGLSNEEWLGNDYKAVMAEARALMDRISDDLDAEFELSAIKATFLYKGEGPGADDDDVPPAPARGRTPRSVGDRPGRYVEEDDPPARKRRDVEEDDPPARKRRDVEEDGDPDEVDADAVAPRHRRDVEEDEPPAPRRSRAAAALEAEEADDVPPPRARARR